MKLKIAEFHPAPIVAPDQWQECEIRADRARLSVRVNGALVTEAQALDEFTWLRRSSGEPWWNRVPKRESSEAAPTGYGEKVMKGLGGR